MGRLDQKIVAITGAGGGIGRVAADVFAAEGATVLILELNPEAANKAVEEITAKGYRAAAYTVDISNEESVKAVFEDIDKTYGGLDVLYNNASVFWGGRDTAVDALDMGLFEKIVKINLFGLVYCSKYAIPLLKKRGGGSIIHTGSSAAVAGVPGSDAYTASKGATVALTRSMAVEYGTFNIRTNCICPAAIQTPMVGESNLSDPNFDDRFFRDRLSPLHRWGKPEEIANTALFLATDGSYMNGAVLVLDGGITINGNVNKTGL